MLALGTKNLLCSQFEGGQGGSRVGWSKRPTFFSRSPYSGGGVPQQEEDPKYEEYANAKTENTMEVGPSTVAPAVTAPGLRWIVFVFFYDNSD